MALVMTLVMFVGYLAFHVMCAGDVEQDHVDQVRQSAIQKSLMSLTEAFGLREWDQVQAGPNALRATLQPFFHRSLPPPPPPHTHTSTGGSTLPRRCRATASALRGARWSGTAARERNADERLAHGGCGLGEGMAAGRGRDAPRVHSVAVVQIGRNGGDGSLD